MHGLKLVVEEEKSNYSKRVQLDEIMKKLFFLHNKRPIIDFLNSLYGDNINYDATITYLNKESINKSIHNNSLLVSNECDMLIKAEDNGKLYEYLLEFQTKNDRSIGIRLFRYSFELKVQNVINLNRPVVIELPNPYVIVLEENKNVPDSYDIILKIHTGECLKYSSKVLKYWEHDLDNLYKNNMYLLFPLKVFEVRKKILKAKRMKVESPKYDLLIEEIRDGILRITREILEHIDLIYDENKIDASEYNEFTVAINNLTLYLCQEVDKLAHIEKEVEQMVKTFYDPKIEEKGIAKGKEIGILQTKREVILELLYDVGIISQDIKTLIENENDFEVLKKWHKLAARSESIEDFKNKVGLTN